VWQIAFRVVSGVSVTWQFSIAEQNLDIGFSVKMKVLVRCSLSLPGVDFG
jgi:hypothetical protein